MSDLISIMLVAALSVLGNIAYFEYKSNRDTRRKVLKERLTKLLLPLYYTFKDDYMKVHVEIEYGDPFEHEAGRPSRLWKKLNKIIESNLHLADDELHGGCLDFLEWTYREGVNEDARFQRAHTEGLEEDKIFIEGSASLFCYQLRLN